MNLYSAFGRFSSLTLCTLALSLGCKPTSKPAGAPPSDTTELVLYSNLVDRASQDDLTIAMQASGIPERNIESLWENVNQFNSIIQAEGLVPSGFVKLDSILPRYDELTIQGLWDKHYPNFFGYNCRITSFDLLKDMIRVERHTTERQPTLMFDEESLDSCGKELFDPEQRKTFRTLFSAIPTPYEPNIQTHLKNIQNHWQQQGVQFIHKNDSTKASLISVVMHSAIEPSESFLFVGHAGVLFPYQGKLMFVEKLTFQAPYQATLFNNRQELSDYLMRMYDVEWEQSTAVPFLMENDELLKGYRPNPQKHLVGSSE